jgi:hypothetical protein
VECCQRRPTGTGPSGLYDRAEALVAILFVALVAVWMVVAARALAAVRSGVAWRR